MATLPRGWRDRLVPLSTPGTRGATGWCLEIHDLLISKYVANRENDRRYCRAAARAGLAAKAQLLQRLAETPLDEELAQLVRGLIEQDYAAPPAA